MGFRSGQASQDLPYQTVKTILGLFSAQGPCFLLKRKSAGKTVLCVHTKKTFGHIVVLTTKILRF